MLRSHYSLNIERMLLWVSVPVNGWAIMYKLTSLLTSSCMIVICAKLLINSTDSKRGRVCFLLAAYWWKKRQTKMSITNKQRQRFIFDIMSFPLAKDSWETVNCKIVKFISNIIMTMASFFESGLTLIQD